MRAIAIISTFVALTSIGAANAEGMVPPREGAVNCAAPSTRVETAICANPKFRKLNDGIAQWYDDAIHETEPEFPNAMRERRTKWMAERDACEPSRDMEYCLTATLDWYAEKLSQSIDFDTLPIQMAAYRIAKDPQQSAAVFRRYPDTILANAWLYYLWRYEPKAGVSRVEAQRAHKHIVEHLRNTFTGGYQKLIPHDAFSLLRTAYQATLQGSYDYVPCGNRILFERHPDHAARAFGGYYRMAMDDPAPFCTHDGPLASREWQAMERAMDTPESWSDNDVDSVDSRAHGYAADYRVQALIAVFHPERTMHRRLVREKAKGIAAINAWRNYNLWRKDLIAKALATIEPAERTYARWMMENRNLSEQQANLAAQGAIGAYLKFQMGRNRDPNKTGKDYSKACPLNSRRPECQ